MPKIKTIKAVAKRFKKNASGTLRHKKINMRHLLFKKNAKRKRHLRKKFVISKFDKMNIMSCLPYI